MTNFMGLTQDEQDAYYAKHPAKKQVRKLCWLPVHRASVLRRGMLGRS
jgi:hypothetical protein